MSAIVVVASILLWIASIAAGNSVLAVGAAAVALLSFAALLSTRRQRRADGAGRQAPGDPSRSGLGGLSRELQRARRHDRHVTVCRIVPRPITQADQVAVRVRPLLRADDVCFAKDGVAYIALGEADGAAAGRAVERLDRALRAAGIPARVSTATFPDDAISLDALLAHARLAPGRVLGEDGRGLDGGLVEAESE